ncbi:oncostatin-M [Saccopteryx bilineata]|uniref:oncostatin-M n=1 Tax=Saccopteryx bilineata TaxID=59482 RepID=UPI00338DA732
MWAQLMRRTLLSLILRLLFLNPVATGNCLGHGQQLLIQLQRQADLMQKTSMLLDPYIKVQGLDTSELRKRCQERSGVFPEEPALQGLSKMGFLQTLNTTLDLVLQRLTAFQQDTPKDKTLETARSYISGIKNNIHCMAQLLRGSSEMAEPVRAGPGTSPPPTPTSDTFIRKLEGCQFLHGYHCFMRSVGQVFLKWEGVPTQRSWRRSPRQALQKGARWVPPSMKGKRLVPRGQLPR